jgi:nuclear pore complex protein Nup188
LIVKSYLVYVHEGSEKADIDQVLMFYTEECLALAQIALEVLHLSNGREGEWGELALDIKEAMVPDAAEYMEGLFRGWAALAQTPVSEMHALFW